MIQAKTSSEEVDFLTASLRCPFCRGELDLSQTADLALDCARCNETYPIVRGIPRMVSAAMRQALGGEEPPAGVDRLSVQTAKSFGFEWDRFPEMRAEWESNFWDYMLPHTAESFRGARVLDAGCGNGRHAYYAASNGAEVWAIDLGSAVEVAKRNNASHGKVQVVQADLHNLPFAEESFDLAYALGVLHHLPDPEAAFHNLVRFVRPGGEIQIYLYWKPEGQPIKRGLLALISAIRQITTRIPHRMIYLLSFPFAAIAYASFVWPYQLLSAAGLDDFAKRLPMKQYARYPFRVCVNDQFDRLSAPIEHRYTRAEVIGWMERAGLENITVRPNYGWCATGRKPLR